VLKKQLPVWQGQPFHSMSVQAVKSTAENRPKTGRNRGSYASWGRGRSKKHSHYRYASTAKKAYSR